ncbi:MAG: Crp/Fnr family transcriptional regulator [Bacteroidota bacterium]
MSPIQQLVEAIHEHQLWTKEIELNRNDFLKIQGTVDTNFYFVVDGSLRIFMIDEFEEHTIRFGYTHNFIAALDSFIHEKSSNLYIQALRKTRLKVIPKHTLVALRQSSDHYRQLWEKLLENLILQQMEREQDILTSSPVVRYHRVLQRSPQLFQEVPNKYIAAYLRMTPETLSRIKKS